jgi:N-acetylmuramoyl-L-alanine amidase/beta-lactamase regulating signal transducer with metallopeptidase domain
LVLEKEKMHKFNRFYLLFSLVISLTIPFLNFEIIKIIPVIENVEIPQTVSIPTSIPNTATVIELQETIDYKPYIVWSLYGLITLVLFFRFIKNCLKLILKSKSNPTVKFQNANLVLVEEKIIPHTFWNSIYINSDDYKNRNIENELYTHELVHVTQKHSIDVLFIETLKTIFWFNPLFYFYKKAIQLNHEFLADEEVVKSCDNIRFYQNLLLQKNNINQVFLTSNLNYQITKKRLIMMTKNTSKTLATLKKTAIIPILCGMIYFFCIEIVAQEKVVNTIENKPKKTPNEEDKIRDTYYSNVRIILKDLRTNTSIDKMYEELTLEEKRKYLSHVPDMLIAKEIPQTLFEKMKTKNMAVWINGKASSKEEIQKYKRTDFSHYTYSFVHKNARSKRFPQEYQYTLYTKKYFDENLKNSHLHYKNDTLRMTISNKKDEFNKVSNILNPNKTKADTIVWFSNDKEEYNLNVNENKKKKTIVIDAGHGGHDFGAKSNNEIESKIVESIAKKITLLNKESDIEIILIRTDDRFISLSERVDFVNKINPNLLISLHVNASKDTEQNGINAFVSRQNEYYKKSFESADDLISKIANNNLVKGDVQEANLFVTKNSKCPAVVLELGFITNENDKKYISSENGKNEIANRIFEFIKG